MKGVYKKTFGIITILLVSGIALFHNIATQYFWYWLYPWSDLVIHFFAGLWVALTSYWVIRFWRKGQYVQDGARALAVTIGAALVVGILWEVFEYQIGLIAYSPWYVNDTLADIFMDILGGGAGFAMVLLLEHIFDKKLINPSHD